MKDLSPYYPYLKSPDNTWVGIQMKQFHEQFDYDPTETQMQAYLKRRHIFLDNNEERKIMNEDNILPFAPITKTDGEYPVGEDWLTQQKLGSSILCRLKKHPGFDYLNIVVADRTQKATFILINDKGTPIPQYVNSQRFSNQFDLIEVLPDEIYASEEKEVTDE